MNVEAQVLKLRQRIEQACRRGGRDPSQIRVVCVTKEASLAQVREAIQAGIDEFGENRVQEAREKIAQIGHEGLKWHFIGHLQRNKARWAIDLFDMIQSIDRWELASELDRLAQRAIPVLIQVNTSHEPTKFGCQPDQAVRLAHDIARLERIRIQGLMTIAPLVGDPHLARPAFRKLRELRDAIQREAIPQASMEILSMGMTHDFEVAIEEGSTMIRVGRAIFGSEK